MDEEVRRLARRRVVTDILTVVGGTAAVLAGVIRGDRTAIVVGAYGLLLGTSTAIVTYSLTRFTGVNIGEGGAGGGNREKSGGTARSAPGEVWHIFTGRELEDDADIEEDTGWLIGRLENVIVLTLVLAGEYTALSIIFAAKSWVRREDTAGGNTTYYLAGTLVNFTYSIVIGLGTDWILNSL